MKRPVMVYVGVILIMAWQAANRWIGARLDGSLLSMIGAYLFVMSDSALAVERFRGSWRSAPFWVLTHLFRRAVVDRAVSVTVISFQWSVYSSSGTALFADPS